MLRIALALALVLSACAGETSYVAPEGQDDAWIRDAAESAWLDVGVEAPKDYTVLFLAPDALADACGVDSAKLQAGSQLGGCTPASDVVLLNGENSPEQQIENLTHELGHVMRGGDARHLGCGADADRGTAFGGDVMCLSGAGPGGMPTARDAAFVAR